MTADGLCLFVTPDKSRPGGAASKLWRMGYRFRSRQKTYSIGPYGNGKDGTFSLADARRECDKAKDLLKEGKDPSTEKQLDKHRQAAARDIKRPDVLALMRSYEAEGKLETRESVRSIGEQICVYADIEGDGYNPFRNLNGQMIANISTPRPGVTEPRDVT